MRVCTVTVGTPPALCSIMIIVKMLLLLRTIKKINKENKSTEKRKKEENKTTKTANILKKHQKKKTKKKITNKQTIYACSNAKVFVLQCVWYSKIIMSFVLFDKVKPDFTGPTIIKLT